MLLVVPNRISPPAVLVLIYTFPDGLMYARFAAAVTSNWPTTSKLDCDNVVPWGSDES